MRPPPPCCEPLSSLLMGVWLGLIAPGDEELTTNIANERRPHQVVVKAGLTFLE